MAKSNESNEKVQKDTESSVQPKQQKQPKKADKNKKPNIFVRMGRKIKETFSELKRVTWPTVPQALKATGVVIVIVLVCLVIVTAVNYGFSALLELLTTLGE